jgi:hypothetical protein
MKNTISTLGIIVVMGSFITGAANASIEKPEGTIYDPLEDSRQCNYELYCNKDIGEVGISPEHYIMNELESGLGWDSFRFSNKNPY